VNCTALVVVLEVCFEVDEGLAVGVGFGVGVVVLEVCFEVDGGLVVGVGLGVGVDEAVAGADVVGAGVLLAGAC
jgi:hypothetical protein